MRDQRILTPYYIDQAMPGLKEISEAGWLVNEPPLSEDTPQKRLVQLYAPLKNWVTNTIAEGYRPVSIAGDCCTSLGVLAGLQEANIEPTMLWLDAHGDFNTWETTPSGFLGGMPLAMLVGRGDQSIAEGVGLESLAEDRVILCDGRDLDPEEKDSLDESTVRQCANLEEAARLLPTGGPIYVHFDTDFINPAEAPAMNYPTPGGPSSKEIGAFFRRLASTKQVGAVSVSSWNPSLDSDGRTAKIVLDLIIDLLGA